MDRKTSELIIGAIHDLSEKRGSSSQEILKFIAQKYDVNPREIQSHVFAAIGRGLEYGLLARNEGLYRLQEVVPQQSSSKLLNSDDKKAKPTDSKSDTNAGQAKQSNTGPLVNPIPKPARPRVRRRTLPKKRGAKKNVRGVRKLKGARGVRKARGYPKKKKKKTKTKTPRGRQAAALRRKRLNQRKRRMAKATQKKQKPKKEENKPKKDDFWPDWKFFRNMKQEDKKDKDREKEREEKNKSRGIKQRQRRKF